MTKDLASRMNADPAFHTGVMVGLKVAKWAHDRKKKEKKRGVYRGGLSLKEMGYIVAGPWGWLALALKNKKKRKQYEQILQEHGYDPSEIKKVENKIDDGNMPVNVPIEDENILKRKALEEIEAEG